MTRLVSGKIFAATLAIAGTAALASPAAATTHQGSWHGVKQARISAHHQSIWRHAYRAGYNRGWRAGHLASAEPVVTGRSAAVAPLGYQGPFAGDGLLGTGLLDGRGLLGTGVFSGNGALGIGIAGF